MSAPSCRGAASRRRPAAGARRSAGRSGDEDDADADDQGQHEAGHPPTGATGLESVCQPGRTAPEYGIEFTGDRVTPPLGVRRVHDHAVADVHADVADRAVVEHQVAGLQLGLRDRGAGAHLRARRVRQADAGLRPGRHREAGAVEGARAGGAVDVGVADLGERVADRGAGAAGGGDVGRGAARGVARVVGAAARRAAAVLERPSSSLASAALASISAFSLPSSFLVSAIRSTSRLAAAWRISSCLAWTAKSAIIWLCWSLYSETVVSWSRNASGSSDEQHLGRRGERLALVLRDDRVGDLLADGVDLGLLAVEVGLQRGEPGLRLLHLQPGVVVALRGLLGLVVERVDAGLDAVDVRVGVGGGGDQHRAAESGDAQGRENTGSALPAVGHERTVSSLSDAYRVS